MENLLSKPLDTHYDHELKVYRFGGLAYNTKVELLNLELFKLIEACHIYKVLDEVQIAFRKMNAYPNLTTLCYMKELGLLFFKGDKFYITPEGEVLKAELDKIHYE